MSATGTGSSTSQPSGAWTRHRSASCLEPRDPACRDRTQRARRYQVHPDPAWPEVTRQIPRDRLERRLGHPHPVVDGPGHAGVEVHPHDAPATVHQRLDRRGQRLERERAGLEGGGRALGRRGHEAAAQRVLGRERDRVQYAVYASPARPQRLGQRIEIRSPVHVQLQHVDLRRQPRRRSLGHPPRSPEAGQHHRRAFGKRPRRRMPRDRVLGDHAGDHQPLALEDHN